MTSLRGKTALVTGAAHGIGRALATQLVEAGARVALVDVAAEPLAELASRLTEEGHSVTEHVVDVSDAKAMASLASSVADVYGGADLLFNNAGVTAQARFADQPAEDFDWVMRVNFGGVVNGCRAFLPLLLKSNGGHIINISSLFGIIGVPTQAAYCASKFAVRGFHESLLAELKVSGQSIGMTIVHPGGIQTNIISGGRMASEKTRSNIQAAFDRHAIPAEQAASLILRAVQGNRHRLLITPPAVLIDLLKRVLPVWCADILLWAGARAGLLATLGSSTDEDPTPTEPLPALEEPGGTPEA